MEVPGAIASTISPVPAGPGRSQTPIWVLRLSRSRAVAPTVPHMRPAGARVALRLLLVVPASAPAATGERADARAFIEATKRLRASLPPGRPSVSGELVRLYRDSPCTPALEQVPAGRASEELFEATVLYSVAIVMHPLRDELAAFATDLDRIRVRSRVLRSGRAAMRRNIRAVRRIPEPPADFCERAETWRRAGFPPGGAPTFYDDTLARDMERTDARRRRAARAGRLLRRHGAGRRIARMWEGYVNYLVE